jgi:hypothetical protein
MQTYKRAHGSDIKRRAKAEKRKAKKVAGSAVGCQPIRVSCSTAFFALSVSADHGLVWLVQERQVAVHLAENRKHLRLALVRFLCNFPRIMVGRAALAVYTIKVL